MNRAGVEERIKNLEERIKRLKEREERNSARLDHIIRIADETHKRAREILDFMQNLNDRMQDGEEWKRSVDDEEWEV